ncbi:MAG: hypothetical protein WC531_03065 [Candidatus Paceibacterota bacterium]|jgi:hypothetical protein
MLPIGCLTGVVVGWWYQEIWAASVEVPRRMLWVIGNIYRETVVRISQVAYALFCDSASKMVRDWSDRIGIRAYAIILTVFMWTLTSPVRFVLWLRRHPVNVAGLIRAMAAAVYLSANLATFTYGGYLIVKTPEGNTAAGVVGLGLLVGAMLTFGPLLLLFNLDESKTKRFYGLWDRCAKHGKVGLFLADLWFLFKMEVGVVVFSGAYLCLGVALLAGALVFTIIPIALAYCFVINSYRFVSRRGHWLCFGSTLVVTVLSAILFRNYLHNSYALWTVAMIAGLASAGTTEVLRRAIESFLERDSVLTFAATGLEGLLGQHFAPWRRPIDRIVSRVDRAARAYVPAN